MFGLTMVVATCLKDIVFWFGLNVATYLIMKDIFCGLTWLWVVQTFVQCTCIVYCCCPRYKALVQFGVGNVMLILMPV